MAAILTGIVLNKRPLSGVIEEGARKGEGWRFLSMEINDMRFGRVWSCQLRGDDPQYDDLEDANLIGHKVKVTVSAQTAGERTLKDGRKIMQIRTQITNLKDLGVPADEDE
ncbi:hypothetical protein KSC_079830 [Ktedonobacter sp. SOSP1-52]|uniref:hypothetical protein n=1 Tax=Ktedonobacter sp. SOSP1-52 TaxID=2778366 RepID=UPI001915B575|nr:hypothetical protein [Ktedonobacter sp. SOSP1-52]GHO69091.1 hypothetical protein KSC_079830 [Ktedonobacter sp. SOSP1-52]